MVRRRRLIGYVPILYDPGRKQTRPERTRSQELLVARFTASSTHGQLSAAKEARPRQHPLNILTPRLFSLVRRWQSGAVSLSTITLRARAVKLRKRVQGTGGIPSPFRVP